jgi:hypothetical protein
VLANIHDERKRRPGLLITQHPIAALLWIAEAPAPGFAFDARKLSAISLVDEIPSTGSRHPASVRCFEVLAQALGAAAVSLVTPRMFCKMQSS